MNNEQLRIDAVNRFKQLDEDVTKDLKSIVDLAAHICNAPVAMITLIDDEVQWFKAAKGVDIDCTNRESAFCNYTIKQDSLLISNDTSVDERFKDNPLVANAPFVRFYAGSTLTTRDGYAIGSLCVIDFVPRGLDDHQQDSLKVLSKQVMNLMELNQSVHVLQKQNEETQRQKLLIEQSEIKLKALFNSSNDTHILVGTQLEVLAFNKAAAKFVKDSYKKKLIKGVSILEYADAEAVNGLAQYFSMAFAGKTIKREWLMRPGTRHCRWKTLHFEPIKNSEKQIIGVALNSADITERKLHEEQINIQNAALTRIAMFQSHELRRPVASLLGIMSLIKMEDLKGFSYFDMMELSVNELDVKIREIVKDSERTLNSPMTIVA